jgi:hypothetical protein
MIHISSIPTLILPQTPHPQTTHPQNLLVAAAAPSNPTPPIFRSELLLWEGKSCSEKKEKQNENVSRQNTTVRTSGVNLISCLRQAPYKFCSGTDLGTPA